MKAFILGVAITLGFSGAAYAQAPTWTVPAESQRCPSKWGASDERGSANHQKPAAVMNAAKLIKSGEVIELAHVLGPSMWKSIRRISIRALRNSRNISNKTACRGRNCWPRLSRAEKPAS